MYKFEYLYASESICLLPINSIPLRSTPYIETYSESQYPASANKKPFVWFYGALVMGYLSTSLCLSVPCVGLQPELTNKLQNFDLMIC